MTHHPFYHAGLAVAVGMAAQTLAIRLGVPSIIVLLAAGVAVGPAGLGLLDPGAFGAARAELVTLAVTVILFEGGLALRLDDVRRQQRSLILLLTLGAAVSMLVGSAAAHYVLAVPWPIAALYGALVIVTGPTVVTPLLSRLKLDRTVRELLIGEGVLIDPVGAIVAVVAAEYVLGHSRVWEAGWLVFVRFGVGAPVGAFAGVASAAALRRGWIPEELRNPATLGTVLLAAALASRISSEAGLLSTVVQGVVMGNAGLRELGPLRQFKEELTVLLLSFIFVVLAADLSLDAVRALGWPVLVVVALVVWVGRPLSVFLCTGGSGLSVRQRLFVSWICPRGIVAAGMAGLFDILLDQAGIAGGDQLEALVFATVAVTVTVQGLTAGTVARLLRIDVPSMQGTVIIGADAFGRLLAHVLMARHRQVVLVDKNPQYCAAAQAEGLPVYEGDALSVDSLEEAGVRYADTVLALTRNHELNLVIAQRVRGNFRVERILAVAPEADRALFPGDFRGVDDANHDIRVGRARLFEYEAAAGDGIGRALGQLPYGRGEFALLLVRREQCYVATGDQVVDAGDRVLCVSAAADPSPLRALFTVVHETAARDALVSEAAPRIASPDDGL